MSVFTLSKKKSCFNFIVLKIMETKSMEMYEAPKVEVIEVEVEKGFAVTGPEYSPNNLPWG